MLSEQQMKCIELMMTTNKKQKDIASMIGVNQETVSRWVHNDKDFISEYTMAVRQRLNAASAKAYQTMVKLLESKNPSIQYAAARDILDRAGYKPTDKLQVDGESRVIIVGGDKVAD